MQRPRKLSCVPADRADDCSSYGRRRSDRRTSALPTIPAFAICALVNAAAVPHGPQQTCANAEANFDVVKAEVEDALRAYQDCLHANPKRDGCVSAFDALEALQDGLEDAADALARCRRDGGLVVRPRHLSGNLADQMPASYHGGSAGREIWLWDA